MKKRAEQENEHRVIRRLEKAQEFAKREVCTFSLKMPSGCLFFWNIDWYHPQEEELKALKEKAARKQAAATGQTEDIENSKEKDREIAMNRER